MPPTTRQRPAALQRRGSQSMSHSTPKNRKLDLTGQRFGKLIAIEVAKAKNGHRAWLCQCDCGGQTICETNSLTSGHSTGCGRCWRVKDESGNRYGRLLVLERAVTRRGRGAFWRCRCDCGNEIVTTGGSLRYGSSQSCGCVAVEKLRAAVMLPNGVAAMRQALRRARASASERGYEFSLTNEQVIEIQQQNCHYCGSSATNISRHPDHNGEYIYNGIDRVDNSIGYIIGNVVPCCKHCNIAKRDRSVEDFLDWIKRVYHHSIE